MFLNKIFFAEAREFIYKHYLKKSYLDLCLHPEANIISD